MRFYFFILNLLFFINASGECELLLKSMLDYGKLYDNSNEVYYIHPLDIYKNQLTLKDGLFYDYKGRPANTRRFFWNSHNIFIMDKHGDLLFAKPIDGFIHHSSLSRGDEVAMAGTIVLRKGKVTSISNSSGHYLPDLEMLKRMILFLEERGVSFEGVEIKIVNTSEGKNYNFSEFDYYEWRDQNLYPVN